MTIHINPSAFGPVRAVAAEHVVAHWCSEQGGHPTLFGGRRRGHDIVDGDQLIDAKLLVEASASEQNRFEGCTHKLRRDRWKLFDPDRTTELVLVEFPAGWRAWSSTSFTQTTIVIEHEGIRLYMVGVTEFNEILASRGDEAQERKWAFIHLEDDWLDKHRVH